MQNIERVFALKEAAWTATAHDECPTLLDEYSKTLHDDPPNHPEAMQRSYGSSNNSLYHGLQPFEASVYDRTIESGVKTGEYESRNIRAVLDYGLGLLPDELLGEIFVLGATTLEEKVAFSTVCKRFRGVMMSMRKLWGEYRIHTHQPPEQIAAIAEGNGFDSLKACIHRRATLSSVRLFLSFGLEELDIFGWDVSIWGRIDPNTVSRSMQNLRRLAIRDSNDFPDIRIIEEWHMPLLQNLEINFVPSAALGKNILRCKLDEIKEVQLGSLKEFLATSNSLQDLQLSLNPGGGNGMTSISRFYEVCELPSLQTLEVNFVPHPSLAKHLTRFRLTNMQHRIRLAELLDFLSSSTILQELAIDYAEYDDLRITNSSRLVTLPSIVSCEVSEPEFPLMGPVVIARLRMPVLRRLKLKLDNPCAFSTANWDGFRTSLRSFSSLQELELKQKTWVNLEFIDEIIRFAPPHLEAFSVRSCRHFHSRLPRGDASAAPHRQLIRFMECNLTPDFLSTVIDYLIAVGLDGMRIEISNCKGWRDGTFGLDKGVLSCLGIRKEC